MELHVDIVPPTPSAPSTGASARRPVVLVVDPLRSATNATILLDRGARDVFVTNSLRSARQVAQREQAIAAGERDGLPPEGFNFNASPRALRRAELEGRAVVLLSADSPGALAYGATLGPTALVGFTNALAIALHVHRMAPPRVHIICAGWGGTADLADVVAAGLLVSRIARLVGPDVVLTGGAGFCLSTLRLASEPLDALWVSEAGAALRAAGLEEDLAVAAGVGTSDVVPWVLEVEESGGHRVVRLGSAAPV
jgi:2-phosphosulfolactate phosphatase